MNYEEMSDFEINSLVIRILLRGQFIEYHEQEVDELLEIVGFDGASSVARFTTRLGSKQKFDGCNNPSDAWPVIVENKINITYHSDGDACAEVFCESTNDWISVVCKKPLRAAMICFLKMKDAEQ